MIEVLQEWIRAHGALGIFAFLAVENLGVPWPTMLAFLVAMDLVEQGRMSFFAAVVLCTAGHVTGSLVGYAIGRAGDNALMRRLRRGSGVRSVLEWLDRWYGRHGDITVFAARLFGQVRPWASFAAGLGDVGLLPFLGWTIAGSAIQVVVALKLSQVGFTLWNKYPQLHIAMVVLLTLIFWGGLGLGMFKSIRKRFQRDAGTEADTSQSGGDEVEQQPQE